MICETEWGQIPGKTKGGQAWFAYDGAEHKGCHDYKIVETGEFSKECKGKPSCVTDGVSYWNAVANTKWGRLAGKATETQMWYSMRGKEYESSDFWYLVHPDPEKHKSDIHSDSQFDTNSDKE